MAAYAALLSLKYTIERLQDHPRPPIFFDKNQVQSLIKNVNFLQNFLEDYSNTLNEETDALQSPIAEAAYGAEDAIESQMVDKLLDQSVSEWDFREPDLNVTLRKKFNLEIYEHFADLQSVIKDMESIRKEVMEIQERRGPVQKQEHKSSKPAVGSSRHPSMGHNIVVGLTVVETQLVGKLTEGGNDRQLIPIVGMGGIGKTTVAKIVYENPLIGEQFHIRAWASLSQEYSVKDILLELLLCLGSQEGLSEKSEGELGEKLHKTLCGKTYLIVMDDTWSIEAWDNVKLFFPDNKNGSRVIITTRRSDVALHLSSHEDRVIKMEFLDENISWNLFCQIVFGAEDGCPLEFKEIGKIIARNCQGLPLAIVVIGGLLAKSERTIEYWDCIAKNLNLIANTEDNERCFKILRVSYVELPIHLKPCFLYMGVFGENRDIHVSWLIKLWVAEGFLKPISDKSLEDVAEEYLKDLIDRNLVLVRKQGSYGKVKICSMHDILREVCLVEAEKHKFLYVRERHSSSNPQGLNTQRRIAIHHSEFFDALESESVARSLICDVLGVLPSLNCRLLRILKAVDKYSICLLGEYSIGALICRLVNSRYLAISVGWKPIDSKLPPMSHLWNLQTLIIKGTLDGIVAPDDIWWMSQLRHVEVDELYLPDPQIVPFALWNLRTLSRIKNFKCKEVVDRIPFLEKLKIFYSEIFVGSHYWLNNLARLNNLESLHCQFFPSANSSRDDLMQNLSFPRSLKKLTLEGCKLHWEDISTKIGPLYNLQVLKLRDNSFIGSEWETSQGRFKLGDNLFIGSKWGTVKGSEWGTMEGQFCSLKLLEISNCDDLERWTADHDDFPRLEHLVLQNLTRLEEIPFGFGHIPTLQSIQLTNCSDSIINSANNIQEEQRDYGNEDFQVHKFITEIQTDLQHSVVGEEAVQSSVVEEEASGTP